MTATEPVITDPELGHGTHGDTVMRAIPQWFGMEDAIVKYTEAIDQLPTILAKVDDQVVGFMSLKQHGPASGELYVLGVLADFHRQGIGRRMLERAEQWARSNGIRFLQVKTVSEGNPDPNYALTRYWYEAMGFERLEIFPTLWDEWNPCLQYIKYLAP